MHSLLLFFEELLSTRVWKGSLIFYESFLLVSLSSHVFPYFVGHVNNKLKRLKSVSVSHECTKMLIQLTDLSEIKSILTHFPPIFHFYRPGNFRGYRIGTLIWNGWKLSMKTIEVKLCSDCQRRVHALKSVGCLRRHFSF